MIKTLGRLSGIAFLFGGTLGFVPGVTKEGMYFGIFMVIVAQLSVLFGVLFVIGGYNLWPVILCHGLFDTIAFIRFANKRSRYSDLDLP